MTEFVNNILSALGASEEGPDPTRLSGLMEYAGAFLEEERTDTYELVGYFEQMRARIREAHHDRQASFEGRRSQLSESLIEMIERNLAACEGVEEQLTAFLQSFQADQREGCWAALEALEGASEEFRDSSEQLANLATSVPICPRCGSTGAEALCAACQLDRLVPDPDLQNEDPMQFPVPEEFMAVYQAYEAVLQGEGNLAGLANALQPLEFSLLEAQALAEQSLDENPEDEIQQDLVLALENTLAGLEKMNQVRENRQTRELNQGWLEVFKGSVLMGQLLARMAGEQPDAGLVVEDSEFALVDAEEETPVVVEEPAEAGGDEE